MERPLFGKIAISMYVFALNVLKTNTFKSRQKCCFIFTLKTITQQNNKWIQKNCDLREYC